MTLAYGSTEMSWWMKIREILSQEVDLSWGVVVTLHSLFKVVSPHGKLSLVPGFLSSPSKPRVLSRHRTQAGLASVKLVSESLCERCLWGEVGDRWRPLETISITLVPLGFCKKCHHVTVCQLCHDTVLDSK